MNTYSVLDLFDKQVKTQAQAIALQDEKNELSYAYLNDETNRLAHYLLDQTPYKHTFPPRIALCFHSPRRMISAILAVLKTGATYVPLDTSSPNKRKQWMLNDVQADLLLTDHSLSCAVDTPNLKIDEVNISEYPASPIPQQANITGNHLAYIMYTSGSTGRPKGVMIEHVSLVNLALAQIRTFNINSNDSVVQFAPFHVDASVSEWVQALASGARLCLLDEHMDSRSQALLQGLCKFQPTVLTLPPTVLQSLPSKALLSIRTLILAGESVPQKLLDTWLDRVDLFNAYGPTEATICTTIHKYNAGSKPNQIGRPISNMHTYVLNSAMSSVTTGNIGELYISGAGLSRGYTNDLELTKRKFVDSAISKQTLYRTGDKVRVLKNGDLEYISREDKQVKVAGFRVELGEIESMLCSHSAIEQAVVGVINGSDILDAHVVANKEITAQEILSHLSLILPIYMLPKSVYIHENFPSTTWGKTDRTKVLASNLKKMESKSPPIQGIRGTLLAIFQNLLPDTKIEYEDDFFSLGGDSILAIQMILEAEAKGILIDIGDIFEHPCVDSLSRYAKPIPIETQATPEESKAEILIPNNALPVTAIMHWLYQQNITNPHFYNQTLLLNTIKPLTTLMLNTFLQHIVETHPVLKMRSKTKSNNSWTHHFEKKPVTTSFSIRSESLDVLPQAGHEAFIHQIAEDTQRSLRIDTGPIMSACLFLYHGKTKYLFLAINHLHIDTVSWRILLDDLNLLYHQYEQEKVYQLKPEQTDYFEWAHQLQIHAKTQSAKTDGNWWLKNIPNHVKSLPTDKNGGTNDIASSATVTLHLDTDHTHRLLHLTPQAFHTRIHETLVTALYKGYYQWSNGSPLLLNMEGHGREAIIENANISRTVGWFTSLFPLHISIPVDDTNLRNLILNIKECMRSIPKKGIAYGLTRYLSKNDELSIQLARKPQPEISFNYMGQADSQTASDGLFSLATEVNCGPFIASENQRQHLIDIAGEITKSRLKLDFVFSTNHFTKKHIEDLVVQVETCLKQLIDYSCCPEQFSYSPSDFDCPNLSQIELDKSFNHIKGIDEIYPLTPMQNGLLLYHLKHPSDDTYFVQSIMKHNGPLDDLLLYKAWQEIGKHHAIFRKGIVWRKLRRPLQYEAKKLTHPITIQSIPANTETNQFIKDVLLQERQNGFNLQHPPLSRLKIFHKSADEHYFLWSHHHIILDGWCDGIIWRDYWLAYEQLQREQRVYLAPVKPYKEYVQWLGQQNYLASQHLWKRYLDNYHVWDLPSPPVKFKHREFWPLVKTHCSESLLQQIRTTCKYWGITLHTFFHGVWALLLNLFGGEGDIIHGVTLSGRTANFSDIEKMTGLFINTLPLRTKIDLNLTLNEYFKGVQKNLSFLNTHSTTPLNKLYRWLQIPAGQHLFKTLLVFDNHDALSDLFQQKKTAKWQPNYSLEKTEYPLVLTITMQENLNIDFFFNESLLSGETIQCISSYFMKLINEAVNPKHKVLNQLLSQCTWQPEKLGETTWRNNHRQQQRPPLEHGVHEIMIKAMEQRPNTVAVEYQGNTLTFCEVLDQARQWVSYLQLHGLEANHVVALCLRRSPAFAIGKLAILMAGATFLPIDPANPSERIAYILKNSSAKFLICDLDRYSQLTKTDAHIIGFKQDATEPHFTSDLIPNNKTNHTHPAKQGDNIAYIIFTSGSSGLPKGVKITHNNLNHLIHAQRPVIDVEKNDKVLYMASVGFDASIWEWATAWCNGACLSIVPPLDQVDNLNDTLKKLSPSVALIVPTLLDKIKTEALSNLKILVVGGEQISLDLLQLWRQHTRVINAYGPTETTVLCSFFSFDDEHSVNTIGKPIANTQMFILDFNRNPVPPGVTGEIYVAGAGVGAGYLDPHKEGYEKVPDPLIEYATSEVIYRTGDLGRYHQDGNIEYIGRADKQIKIRGFRVELGEIEHIIRSYPGVKHAQVHYNGLNEKCLTAKIEPQPKIEALLDKKEILKFCQHRLPPFMVPDDIQISNFHTTPSGKLKRTISTLNIQNEPINIRTEKPISIIEKTLWNCWSKVLGIKSFGIYDEFFRLGGDSINCIEVTAHMESAGFHLAINDIFLTPTIYQLAQKVQPLKKQESHIQTDQRLKLLPKQIDFRQHYQDKDKHSVGFVQNRIYFNQPLDKTLAQVAWQKVINSHEALRCTFPTHADVQHIQQHVGVQIESLDWSNLPSQALEEILKKTMHDDQKHPFDLQVAPLMRWSVIQLPQNKSLLLWSFHHIIADAWSRTLLLNSFISHYNALTQNTNTLENEIQSHAGITDYLRWIQSKNKDAARTFWQRQLSGIKCFQHFSKTIDNKPIYSDMEFIFSAPASAEIKNSASMIGVSISTLIHAAWYQTLRERLRKDEFTVGITLSGRHAEVSTINTIIGMLANTVPLRIKLSRWPANHSWLRDLQLRIIQLNDYAFVSETRIRQWLNLPENTPLYDSLVMVGSLPVSHAVSKSGLEIEQDVGGSTWNTYPLGLSMIPDEHLRFKLGYDQNQFSPHDLEQMVDRFKHNLCSIQ